MRRSFLASNRLPIDERVLRMLLAGALCGLVAVGVAMARTPIAQPEPIVIPPPDFVLEMSPDGRTLAFSGTVDHGLTAALRAALAAHPQIRRVTLDSNGGNIYEARGAVRVLREHRLDTRVDRHCASACALIFVGGHARELAPDARLGFHGYRIATERHFGMVDPDREMQRDLAIYRAQSIDEGFVQRLGALPVNPMWYPDHAALRLAGVTTAPGGLAPTRPTADMH